MTKTATMDPKLLDILVCPLTRGPLTYDREAQELISEKANLAYPVRDGIPIMLVDEARPLDLDPTRVPAADKLAGQGKGESGGSNPA